MLEDGTRLTKRLSNSIVLACTIVAPTDHGFDFAGMGIQSDERNLRSWRRLVVMCPFLFLICGKFLFDQHQSFTDSVNCGSLETQVQRGVNAVTAIHHVVFG